MRMAPLPQAGGRTAAELLQAVGLAQEAGVQCMLGEIKARQEHQQ